MKKSTISKAMMRVEPTSYKNQARSVKPIPITQTIIQRCKSVRRVTKEYLHFQATKIQKLVINPIRMKYF